MKKSRLLICLALPTIALAQTAPTHISPVGAASGLGNSNNNIPFSWTPCSYQQVHSKDAFSNPAPTPFTKMSMRMASGFANFAGKTIDVELFHATSPNDATTASATFASNVVTGSEVNTLVRKMVNLPTVPDNSWAIVFPFDNMYVWPGSHLSWRANVYGNSNGNAIFTYPLDAWTTGTTVTTVGTGCTAAGGSGVTTISATTPVIGTICNFTINSKVALVTPCLLTLGTSTTTWGALTLPFDLTPFGATGCKVYNDIAATIPSATSATGVATIPLPIPNNPLLVGATFYAQGAFVDASFNALGLVTTPGRGQKITTTPGVTRIYGLATPPVASGTLGLNFGMAVGFN